MWLANQACFSFVIIRKGRVEGSSAICGIEVGKFRVLSIALFRGKGYFEDDMVCLIFGTQKRIVVVDVKRLPLPMRHM
jgi:hypothetical protein